MIRVGLLDPMPGRDLNNMSALGLQTGSEELAKGDFARSCLTRLSGNPQLAARVTTCLEQWRWMVSNAITMPIILANAGPMNLYDDLVR
jgi:hypothetical protein